MRKFYSLVLMATALLIGTNVWAANDVTYIKNGEDATGTLAEAFANADDNSTITVQSELVTLSSAISIGNSDGKTASKSLTLDLNGKTIKSAKKAVFYLYSGALKIVDNSISKGGTIQNTYTSGKYYSINVYGSILKNVNPRTADESDLYTYLYIGEGVNIISDGENTAGKGGIAIMVYPAQNNKFNGISTHARGAFIYGYEKDAHGNYKTSDPRGVANGVRIDVKGNVQGALYAMQTNGQLACYKDAYATYYNENNDSFYGTGTNVPASISDTAYSPYIHIYGSAKLSNTESIVAGGEKKQVALYASGYARWFVEGECEGSTGLYMKSGNVTLSGAEVKSTYEESANLATGATIGVNGGGNAVVVESNGHYAGNCVLAIEDSETKQTTISTDAEEGAALLEVIAEGTESSVEEISINGGTLSGDIAIAISDQTASNDKVTVYGSNLEGTVDADLSDILASGTHTTTTVQDGKTTVVVSKGNGPEVSGNWATVSAATGKNVNWTALEADAAINSGKVSLGELQIVSGDALGEQKLTIANGATLEVTRLIMNDYAQIVVEAGGTLIVTGEQGINAPSVDNIILKTSKDAQAIFLLRPHVTQNRHPSATVQLQTYSWYESSTSYQWQRFGVPTYGAVTKFECVENAVNTQIQAFDNGNWVALGYIGGSPALNVADLNKPFVTYNLIANRAQSAKAPIYNIKGKLVGNENASLNAYSEWNLFSNSYLAKVDVKAFLGDLAGVDQVIYIATPAGVGTYTWDARDLEWAAGVKLNPMAAFILHNPGEAAISAINYEKAVYEPATKGSSPAPRRFAQTSDKTAKLRVIVANEEGVQDDVKMTEKTSNLHNAAKYMNDDLNIYAMADEKAAIVAAEDLENTYVGFSTVKGGKFTISFANVEGREFTLVDHATGARVEIAEGNTYEFTADAN